MMRLEFQHEEQGNPKPTGVGSAGAVRRAAVAVLEKLRPGRQGRRGSANAFFLAASFLVVTTAVALLGMRFPVEAARWMQNQHEIRELQQAIADLRKLEIERLERLKSIEENLDDAGLEVRRKYHLYKPGEKIFVLPPTTAEDPDAAKSLPEVATPATP